jgi:hypothetical protein
VLGVGCFVAFVVIGRFIGWLLRLYLDREEDYLRTRGRTETAWASLPRTGVHSVVELEGLIVHRTTEGCLGPTSLSKGFNFEL